MGSLPNVPDILPQQFKSQGLDQACARSQVVSVGTTNLKTYTRKNLGLLQYERDFNNDNGFMLPVLISKNASFSFSITHRTKKIRP